jgi:NAD-dependent histone deacetylase SIR2
MASEDSTAETRPPKRSKPSAEWEGDDDDDQNDDIPQPGIMKPDITFFGEQLPNTFFDRLTNVDAEHTDLVIVIGTSLKVAPVSEMPNYIPHTVPHIYISLEPIRHVEFDIQLLGSCDVVVQELCRRAGWDLRHEMIPENAPSPKVMQVPGRPHVWAIGAVVGAAAATEQRNGAGDAPSSTAAELVAHTSIAQDATPGIEEKILLSPHPVTSEK